MINGAKCFDVVNRNILQLLMHCQITKVNFLATWLLMPNSFYATTYMIVNAQLVLCHHLQPETIGREIHEVPPQQGQRCTCYSQIWHAHQTWGYKAQSKGKMLRHVLTDARWWWILLYVWMNACVDYCIGLFMLYCLA